MKPLLLVLGFLAACLPQPEPPNPGATVDCWAETCPSDEQANSALRVIAEVYPDFDPDLPLAIEWHAFGEIIRKNADGTSAAAEAPSANEIVVTSWWSTGHEVHHAQDWREGTVDYNHSAPPGLWSSEDDRRIERIALALAAEGFSP